MQYSFDEDYRFEGRTIGLAVVFDGDEQSALDDHRVARRAMDSESRGGYVGTPGAMPHDIGLTADVGTIFPPKDVKSLDDRLDHSSYYDEHLIHPLIDATKEIIERHGFRVHVIPVPSGRFNLRDLANRAQQEGCDLFAIQTVAIARTWNVPSQYQARGSQALSSTLRWRLQTGGLTLLSMSVFDITTNRIVWKHHRREISAAELGPLLGELYDERHAAGEYAQRPSEYQGHLYKTSGMRSLHLLFANPERRFHPFPAASDSVLHARMQREYTKGAKVYVRPAQDSRVWHIAEVQSATSDSVTVKWLIGMWHRHAQQTQFSKKDVLTAEDWPPIIWVRSRDKLEYTPFRLSRYNERTGFVYTTLAGQIEDQTWHVGRVGVVPTKAGLTY